MISKYSHKGLIWVDLQSPSKEEILHIIDQHGIPTHIQEKIKTQSAENIVDLNYDFSFISLQIPINNRLIFFVNDKLVLSIHDYPIQAFMKFSNEMELDIIGEETSKINNNKLLFAYLLKNLYLSSQNELGASYTRIKNLENKITHNHKKLKSLKTWIIVLSFITTISIIILCL